MYTKSILGGFKGHSGHCAYNRTNGAKLVPDPSGNYKEVLRICLTDRWYNPVDDYIGEEAPFVLDITEKSEWQTITIERV